MTLPTFVDNETGQVSVAVLSTDTTINLGAPWAGPTVGAPNFVRLVLDPPLIGVPNPLYEVIYATVINGNAQATVITNGRGVEGTTPVGHALHANWVCALTALDVTTLNNLGTLGYAQITADFGPFSAVTDITGLSVAVTVGSGRRIRITGFCSFADGTVNGDTMFWQVWEGATQLSSVQTQEGSTGHTAVPTVLAVLTPSAGAHTYKIRGARASGTGTFTVKAAATSPAFILVEDIGT